MILSRIQGGVFTLFPVSHVTLAFVLDLSERRAISSCSTIIIHVHSWSPSVQLCFYTVKMLADKEADVPAEGGNLTVTSGTRSASILGEAAAAGGLGPEQRAGGTATCGDGWDLSAALWWYWNVPSPLFCWFLLFLDISEVAKRFTWVTSSLYIPLPVLFLVFSCLELFKHSQLWF